MKALSKRNPLDYNRLNAVSTNVMLPALYKKMLKYLSDRTRVRQAEFVREAMKDLLIKYRHEFKGSEYEF